MIYHFDCWPNKQKLLWWNCRAGTLRPIKVLRLEASVTRQLHLAPMTESRWLLISRLSGLSAPHYTSMFSFEHPDVIFSNKPQLSQTTAAQEDTGQWTVMCARELYMCSQVLPSLLHIRIVGHGKAHDVMAGLRCLVCADCEWGD